MTLRRIRQRWRHKSFDLVPNADVLPDDLRFMTSLSYPSLSHSNFVSHFRGYKLFYFVYFCQSKILLQTSDSNGVCVFVLLCSLNFAINNLPQHLPADLLTPSHGL